MDDPRMNLEVIAPSVEEAVAKGLAELGLAEDGVEVEVLDPGSRGLFGIGSRQARVRLTMKMSPDDATISQAVIRKMDESVGTKTEETRYGATAAVKEPVAALIGEAEELQIAVGVVEDLLQAMKVRAQVTAHHLEPDEEHSKLSIWVDVHGSDLSILIGPRIETLNALQYIAGMITCKELGRSIPLIVDVEGYRARRSQQLRQLARRMADQAVKTGKRQLLEPMPASERRIVHIELKGNPQVTTESVGEEPRRKVTIIPK